jgi:hypothetical protein
MEPSLFRDAAAAGGVDFNLPFLTGNYFTF